MRYKCQFCEHSKRDDIEGHHPVLRCLCKESMYYGVFVSSIPDERCAYYISRGMAKKKRMLERGA